MKVLGTYLIIYLLLGVPRSLMSFVCLFDVVFFFSFFFFLEFLVIIFTSLILVCNMSFLLFWIAILATFDGIYDSSLSYQ